MFNFLKKQKDFLHRVFINIVLRFKKPVIGFDPGVYGSKGVTVLKEYRGKSHVIYHGELSGLKLNPGIFEEWKTLDFGVIARKNDDGTIDIPQSAQADIDELLSFAHNAPPPEYFGISKWIFSSMRKDGKFFSLDGEVELSDPVYIKYAESVDDLTKEEQECVKNRPEGKKNFGEYVVDHMGVARHS